MAFYKCARIYVTENSNTEINTASGPIANFNTLLATPLLSLKANFKATQEAGTPTPDSPKAINGVSAVSVVHLGGNFFNKNSIESGKLINASGNEVSYADWNLSDYIEVIEGSSYYLYGLTNHPNTNQDNFELFDEDKNKVGYANVKTNEQPYVIPSGVAYIKCTVKNPDLDTAQFGVSINASFVPYNPVIEKTIINLGGTYYGGYVEQDKDGNREIVVTHKAFVFTGTENWQVSTNFFYLPAGTLEDTPIQQNAIGSNGMMINPMTNKQIRLYPNYGINSQYISMESTVTDIQGYLSNGIQFLYELAEPFTIALPDGERIKSFAGINNIYADTGDTTIEYRNLTQGG